MISTAKIRRIHHPPRSDLPARVAAELGETIGGLAVRKTGRAWLWPSSLRSPSPFGGCTWPGPGPRNLRVWSWCWLRLENMPHGWRACGPPKTHRNEQGHRDPSCRAAAGPLMGANLVADGDERAIRIEFACRRRRSLGGLGKPCKRAVAGKLSGPASCRGYCLGRTSPGSEFRRVATPGSWTADRPRRRRVTTTSVVHRYERRRHSRT